MNLPISGMHADGGDDRWLQLFPTLEESTICYPKGLMAAHLTKLTGAVSPRSNLSLEFF